MAQPDPKDRLTEAQIQLLRDLAALQEAGLISNQTRDYANEGYDEGSVEVTHPATVTFEGMKFIKDLDLAKNNT